MIESSCTLAHHNMFVARALLASLFQNEIHFKWIRIKFDIEFMLQSTKRKSDTRINTSWKASYINSIRIRFQFNFSFCTEIAWGRSGAVCISSWSFFLTSGSPSLSIDWFISIFHISDLFILSVCSLCCVVLFFGVCSFVFEVILMYWAHFELMPFH